MLCVFLSSLLAAASPHKGSACLVRSHRLRGSHVYRQTPCGGRSGAPSSHAQIPITRLSLDRIHTSRSAPVLTSAYLLAPSRSALDHKYLVSRRCYATGQLNRKQVTQNSTGGGTCVNPVNRKMPGGPMPVSTAATVRDLYRWRWGGRVTAGGLSAGSWLNQNIRGWQIMQHVHRKLVG